MAAYIEQVFSHQDWMSNRDAKAPIKLSGHYHPYTIIAFTITGGAPFWFNSTKINISFAPSKDHFSLALDGLSNGASVLRVGFYLVLRKSRHPYSQRKLMFASVSIKNARLHPYYHLRIE